MTSLLFGKQPVYLIDTACYKPPEEYIVDRAEVTKLWDDVQRYPKDVGAFLDRVMDRSGLSEHGTYLPPSIHPKFCGEEPKTDLKSATKECHMAITSVLEELMEKTGLRVDQVDILVTTCSIFNPTPSMASMLVNHFKMRPDIQSYHLGGMGCSNGAVAINLIHDMLQSRPGSNAVFITTETTTPAYYRGKDRARLVTNMIFRMGAAASLISNKASWGARIKYKLLQHIRVHIGASNAAYNTIQYSADDEGINGIRLGMDVVTEASTALTKAMWRVGPHIMTWRQLAEYGSTWVRRHLGDKTIPPYTPAFGMSVQHFLIHAGGSKVLMGIGKALHLPAESLMPSNAVMHDYGNVSSSTTWYTLAFIETVQGVAAGDKILQVGLGSGVKCGVNVWQAQKDVRAVHRAWEHRLTSQQAAEARTLDALSSEGYRAYLALRVMYIFLVLGLLLLLHFTVLRSGKRVRSNGVFFFSDL